jgi:alanyl-tRNA synthetase
LLAESSKLLGGRGGGKPELAQGGGPLADKIQEAIRLAAEKIQSDER